MYEKALCGGDSRAMFLYCELQYQALCFMIELNK
jgi:hypothetical protein